MGDVTTKLIVQIAGPTEFKLTRARALAWCVHTGGLPCDYHAYSDHNGKTLLATILCTKKLGALKLHALKVSSLLQSGIN